MPNALITGIGGFTGKYLADELRRAGYTVFGTVHKRAPLQERVFGVDLGDLEGMSQVVSEVKPDIVAHLAAISFVPHRDVAAIYEANLVGTHNLLQALADCSYSPRSVLLASSASVYGNATDDPITEDTPTNPENDYAVSKLAMEHMARLWYERLPLVIVRPFNYTGVGQAANFLLPKIVNHFKKHAGQIELGNIDISRDFSDVRTVVKIYRKLLEKAPSGEIFNICSGRVYSISEVLEFMANIAGYHINVKTNPLFVRDHDALRMRGSQSKLLNCVGPEKSIPLEQTLRWMYESPSES